MKKGLIALLTGILILGLILNLGVGRNAMPQYDNTNNHFDLTISKAAPEAIPNNAYAVDLKVTNQDQSAAGMYIQCSILDLNTNSRLSRSGVTTVTNCQPNEPFTSTARVTLDKLESKTYKFTFKAPSNLNGNYVVYCAAYEQCGGNSYESDHITQPVTLKGASTTAKTVTATVTAATVPKGSACVKLTDCDGWLLSGARCTNGFCVTKEAAKSDVTYPKFDDASISAWAMQHKTVLIGLSILLILVGMLWSYKAPKFEQ